MNHAFCLHKTSRDSVKEVRKLKQGVLELTNKAFLSSASSLATRDVLNNVFQCVLGKPWGFLDYDSHCTIQLGYPAFSHFGTPSEEEQVRLPVTVRRVHRLRARRKAQQAPRQKEKHLPFASVPVIDYIL